MATSAATATVRPVPRLTKGYEQVAEHFRRRIRDGDLQPNDRLDSVRDIAEEWETTPNTVHRSIRLLRDEGWIEVSQGRRPTVLGVPSERVTPNEQENQQ